MQIIEKITSQQTLRQLKPAESELGVRVLTTNLNLQPNEGVLVVTDQLMKNQEAALWFESAKTMTPDVELLVIDGMTRSGQEPPPELITACTQAEVVIFQTTYSLTHTSASKAARARGARVASLPGVKAALIMAGLSGDYGPIRALGTKLKQKLEGSQQITISSAFGTNLTAQIRQTGVIDDNGFILPGEVGNLPAGEVFFCPMDESTNGTWVINGSLADEDELDQPVALAIVKGKVTAIKGGQAAKRLQAKLEKVGPSAFIVAEIGIGTNPAASPTGELIEAEKAYCTAHLAVGNSAGFGGLNTAPLHLDGVTLEPTITVDNRIILKNGTFQIE